MSLPIGLFVAGLTTLVIVPVTVVAWHRRRTHGRVSEIWLAGQTQRESIAGVDLPRWRFPAELKVLERQQRVRQIASARARMFQGKRA